MPTSPSGAVRRRTRRAPVRKHAAMHEPPRHKVPAPRSVVVDVIGPKGGYLKIDGNREDVWFGVKHDLAVGPHTFEFVPADSANAARPSPQPVTRR